jgi:nicotinamidase-related amidase
MAELSNSELPIPPHFNVNTVSQVWRVPYQQRALEARQWASQHIIPPAAQDRFKLALIAIDVQNTFCIPEFELFVGGRSGLGAVEDNQRLCRFIYRNLCRLTHITATQDTHRAMQIFHPIFLVNAHDQNPAPHTLVSLGDLQSGRWKFNPALANSLGIDVSYGQQQLLHYAEELERRGKYALTIWPYHAMLGGIGHALVSAVEEALFFHTIARDNQVELEIKGENPLTEHYSAIGPEVLDGPDGKQLASKNERFLQMAQDFDALIIAGQAKSHCVAWTIDDLLAQIQACDGRLAQKIYLLDDCTSPVVVPGVVDYTDQAEAAYQKFSQAGMHRVLSTQPVSEWPGMAR